MSNFYDLLSIPMPQSFLEQEVQLLAKQCSAYAHSNPDCEVLSTISETEIVRAPLKKCHKAPFHPKIAGKDGPSKQRRIRKVQKQKTESSSHRFLSLEVN